MKYKNGILFICLIVCLISMAGVCASDVNEPVVSSENQTGDVIKNQEKTNVIGVDAIDEGAGECAGDLNVDIVDECDILKASGDNQVIYDNNKEVIGATDDGTFDSLNSKISAAGVNSKIVLENNYSYNSGFSTGGIEISKSLTIDGAGHSIDGNGQSRIFKITNNAQVTIINLTFLNGKADLGGAIHSGKGALTVINSTFKNNTVEGQYSYAGAIYTVDCVLKVSGSKFIGNSAEYCSGAIYNFFSPATIVDSIFEDNEASWAGTIFCGDTLTVINSTFKNNKAVGKYGGAGGILNAEGRILTVINSTFEGNVGYDGAAIRSADSTLTVINSKFINNLAESYGGAICIYSNVLNVTDSSFINNTASRGGSAMWIGNPDNVEIKYNTFFNNDVGNFDLDDTNTVIFPPKFDVATVEVNDSSLRIVVFETANVAFNGDVVVNVGGEDYLVSLTDGFGVSEAISSAISSGWHDAIISFNGTEVYPSKNPENIRLFVVEKDSFYALYNLIRYNVCSHNYEIVLNHDFKYYYDDSRVCVIKLDNNLLGTNELTIDGNGHTIDAGMNTGMFNVKNSKVLVKNLNLVNSNYGSIRVDEATLTIINSNFTNNNIFGSGAAITNSLGTLTVINSSFTNNTARYDGGAIYNYNARLTVINSTFKNNHAGNGGAIYVSYSPNVAIKNSTFIKSSVYGIDLDETNSAYNAPKFDVSTIFEDNTLRIVVFETANIGFCGNVVISIGDKNYTVVLNNGVGKSEAINSLTPGYYNVTVNFNGTDDYDAITPVNIELFVVKEGSYSNLINLISYNVRIHNYEMVLDYDIAPDYDHDDVDDGVKIFRDLIGYNNFTIDGNGHTINGNGHTKLFSVGDVNLTIKNLNFINGYASEDGPVSCFSGTLTVINSNFTNNAGKDGGAIYCYYGGTLIIINSTFINSTAENNGGAIYCYGNLSLVNSTLSNNKAYSLGGAIWCQGELSVEGSTFESSSSGKDGGAIYCMGILSLNNSTLDNSFSQNSGGAIYLCQSWSYYGGATINNAVITNNNANDYGGAIYANCEISIANSTFKDNYAGRGGVIYIFNTVLNLTSSNFTDNYVGGDGGAIMGTDYTNMEVDGSIFHNNSASCGGAIYTKGTLSLSNSIFSNNSASDGGAICNYEGILTITSSSFKDNSGYCGGAVYNYDGSVVMVSSYLTNNIADYGGAIYLSEGYFLINGSTLDSNVAVENGGAIYISYTYGLEIFGSSLRNNKAYGNGGAIYHDGGKLIVNNTELSHNYAIGNMTCGGAIYNYEYAYSIITGSTFKSNNATNGTALYSENGGDVNITDTKFVSDTVEGAVIDDSNEFITPLSFVIFVPDFVSGEAVEITVNETSKDTEFNGNVTVVIGSQNFTVEIIRGYGLEVVTPDIGVGKHSATLTYNQSTFHDVISNIFKVTANPEISIVNITDFEAGSSITIYIEAQKGFNEKLNITIAGTDYPVNMIDGAGNVTIAPIIPLGTYRAAIHFSGNDYFTADDAESNEFRVTKNPDIQILNIDSFEAGSSITIYVVADSSFAAVLNITIAGTDYPVNVVNGEGNVTISPNIAPGTYEAVINYSGDETFAARTVKSNVFTVTAPKFDPEVIVSPLSNNEIFTVSLPGDATGNVTLTINGRDYVFNVTGGKANVKIPQLSDGDYNYTLTYSGDDKYLVFVYNGTVRVNNTHTGPAGNNSTSGNGTNITKLDSGLTIRVADISVGEVATVYVEINANVIGKVTIDGKIVSIVNGKGTFSIANLTSGEYTIVAIFEGDEHFNKTNNTATFKVNKIEKPAGDNPFNVEENKTLESASPIYSISLPDDATGTLTVIINGKNYTEKVVNGKATVNVTDMVVGSYSVVIVYSGDDKYDTIIQNSTLNVVVNPKVVMKQTSALYTAKYSVTVYGKDGKVAKNTNVVFYIDGKKINTVKTDSNGIATFNLPSVYLPNKKYTIKATALGESSSTVVGVKQILSIKKVKVKKSAKKLVLTATLKKVDGKVLKGKTITFKFNGKKYKAKTNNKGVAKVTIKKSVFKKLKAGKKVTYAATYGEITKKVTVKVKK